MSRRRATSSRSVPTRSYAYFSHGRDTLGLRIGVFYFAILLASFAGGILIDGNYAAVNAIAGVATTQEEIEAETKGLGVRTHNPQSGA